jgi:hypothetical protein
MLLTGVAVLLLAGAQAPVSTANTSDKTTQTFSNVRYLGGAPEAPNRIFVWSNTLTISESKVHLSLADGAKVEIEPSKITALTYAGVKHKLRWDEKIGIVMVPIGTVTVIKELSSRDHFLTIDYTRQDGKEGGILLELHKDSANAVIDAIRAAIQASAVQLQP